MTSFKIKHGTTGFVVSSPFLLWKSNTPEICISELCCPWLTLFSGSRRNSWTFEVYMASFRNHWDNPSHLLCMGFIPSGSTFSNFIFENHFQFLLTVILYFCYLLLLIFSYKLNWKDKIISVSSWTGGLLPLWGHIFLCCSLTCVTLHNYSNLSLDVSRFT
jgi:Ca2+/Na+ antiporter